METILLILKLAVGFVLIIKGADWLTDGASAIARHFGIPSLVIGLTIVAFGTSAPELVVSVVSALGGKTEMAIGNVVGSNIFNGLAIMGLTAIMLPVACSRNNIRYDVPFCIIASVAVTALALDDEVLRRGDGIALLCFFAIFMAYTFVIAKQGKEKNIEAKAVEVLSREENDLQALSSETVASSENPSETRAEKPRLWRHVLIFLLGLACLIIGGEWLVDGASGIAALLGVSQSIIALTIVAAGTSFPELVTALVAARKGDTDMAMGDVIGSNVFNIFMVLGAAASIEPLSLGHISIIDLGTMTGGAILLWFLCRFGRRHFCITRLEGLLLFLCAVAYYTYAVLTAKA